MQDEPKFDLLNLKSLLEHAHLAVVIHRMDTSIVYANPVALNLLGARYDQIIGVDAHDPSWYFVDEFGHRLPVESYPVNKVIMASGAPLMNEIIGRYDEETHSVSWYLVNAYQEPGGNDEPGHGFVVVTFNDISQQLHLFSYHDIIENTQDIIIVTEAENITAPIGPKIIFVNKAFEELTGYKASEVIGETPRILQGRGTNADDLRRIHTALKKQEPIRETVLNYTKDGKPYWLDMNIFPLRNKFGKVTHFAAIERDVTEITFQTDQLQKRNEDLKALKEELEKMVEERTHALRIANHRLERLAYYDELTKVPNRRSFKEQASRQSSYAQRHHQCIITGIVDVDRFKKVNDTYGHDAGDAVIAHVAEIMKSRFRQEDAFGRIGGEEFAFSVLMEAEENGQRFCERLRQEIEEASVEIDGNSIKVTVSIGYTTTLPTSEFDLPVALKEADRALYLAKQSGRNIVVRYSEGASAD